MPATAWTIGLQIINFSILVWLLHRFLYRPVLRLIDARKSDVDKHYDAAKASEEKAKAALAAIESERAQMATERQAMLKSAMAEAEHAAASRREKAEREAQDLLDAGRKALASERAQALRDARQIALDLSADLTRRLISEIPMSLRAEAWIEQIERHLKDLPKTEIETLTRPLADGASLTLTTTAALPADAMDAWRDRLGRALGSGIAITFAVDSNLIAGAELHFPAAVLRFSLKSLVDTMRAEALTHANTH